MYIYIYAYIYIYIYTYICIIYIPHIYITFLEIVSDIGKKHKRNDEQVKLQ